MDLSNIEVKKDLQIVFMGTPDFAVPILKSLIENYNVRAIVTQPDRKGNRGQIQVSAVKQVGLDNTILVLQPNDIKTEYEEISNLNPDLIITCAYGQILPKALLDLPRLGCINVHASLLPKLRGGAPIQKAIMDGHTKTGITIMYMDTKMDEGDIISQLPVDIEENDTYDTLHDKLSKVAVKLLLDTLPSIINKTNSRIKQDNSLSSYAFTIKKEDEKINFNVTAKQVYNKIRALNSHPGAYCIYKGKRLKVFESYITDNYPTGFNGEVTAIYNDGFGVKVSNGEVVFKTVQLEGCKVMDAKSFINGNKDIVGKVLQ